MGSRDADDLAPLAIFTQAAATWSGWKRGRVVVSAIEPATNAFVAQALDEDPSLPGRRNTPARQPDQLALVPVWSR